MTGIWGCESGGDGSDGNTGGQDACVGCTPNRGQDTSESGLPTTSFTDDYWVKWPTATEGESCDPEQPGDGYNNDYVCSADWHAILHCDAETKTWKNNHQTSPPQYSCDAPNTMCVAGTDGDNVTCISYRLLCTPAQEGQKCTANLAEAGSITSDCSQEFLKAFFGGYDAEYTIIVGSACPADYTWLGGEKVYMDDGAPKPWPNDCMLFECDRDGDVWKWEQPG